MTPGSVGSGSEQPARVLAQTNVQLIRQVVAAGWSDVDLLRLRRAYELVMWAFSGQFRSNGKTQIAHHVGTASALVSTGQPPTVVIAGLAHSLYFLGEFGSGRLGAHPEKRARVRDTIDRDVETHVYEYTEMPWGSKGIEGLIETAAGASDLRRGVVAMRVANELDEFADFGMRLSAIHGGADTVKPEDVDLVVKVAAAHGFDELGAWLADVCAHGASEPLRNVVVSTADNMVFVPPASYARRLHIAVQDSRVGHKVAESVPGARRAAVWVRRRIA